MDVLVLDGCYRPGVNWTGSQKWLAYWTEQLNRFIAREDDVKGCKIPLEVIRACIQSVEPGSVAYCLGGADGGG